MATAVPPLREWGRTVPERIAKGKRGFVDYKPYGDHFSENHATFAKLFAVGAVPLVAGLWAANYLANTHSSHSRPRKALNLAGQALLGFTNLTCIGWLAVVSLSAFSKGRVFALNTERSRLYVKSTWTDQGVLDWVFHRFDADPEPYD